MVRIKVTGPQLLAAALKREGLNQSQLTRRISASEGLVSRWLSGERVPELKFALLLEEVLNIPAKSWVKGS